MKVQPFLFAFCLVFQVHFFTFGQNSWPKEIPISNGGKVVVYQPQNETLNGNLLSTRAAVSVRETDKSEPVFGAVWADTQLLTDKDNRTATLETVSIKDVRFPNVEDESKIEKLKTLLETEIPKWGLEINLDELVATLESANDISDEKLNTTPPDIIYKNTPTTLVSIDGEPKVEKNKDMNMDLVVNTPFLIVVNPDDKKYYLFAGYFWYSSSAIESGWTPAGNLSGTMKKLDEAMQDQMKENGTAPSEEDRPASPPAILVETNPTELIQSDGEANFQSIEGTSLLYMENSDNDILMDIDAQKYYVLLSGRWYVTSSLNDGPWAYVASDKLPEDFSKIPAGSEKDGVLASVAGTQEAKEARMDAQIPQTAKVERSSTECEVTYDGSPKFEAIEGTSLEVAVNTSSTVLKSGKKYYAVDNGVWFVSDKPDGPWKVSTERPAEVKDIPPTSSAYNTKYVYIYDTTPEYVYVGYTPGYLGNYVYGPTVVYGTGFYYRPWYGSYYYPRPVTWGFGMHYNPWSGWSMSFGFSTGFFSFSIGGGYGGGWWGPPMYRPPYRPPYYAHHGYYGGGNRYRGNTNINIDNSTNINIGNNNNRTNNLYNHRKDAVTKDRATTRDQVANRAGNRAGNNNARPSNRPATRPATNNNINTADIGNRMQQRPNAPTDNKARNNVYSDRNGNVYRQQNNGNWQQRSQSGWEKSRQTPSNMNRQSQMRQRGQTRTNNYNRSRPAPSRSAPMRRR